MDVREADDPGAVRSGTTLVSLLEASPAGAFPAHLAWPGATGLCEPVPQPILCFGSRMRSEHHGGAHKNRNLPTGRELEKWESK